MRSSISDLHADRSVTKDTLVHFRAGSISKTAARKTMELMPQLVVEQLRSGNQEEDEQDDIED